MARERQQNHFFTTKQVVYFLIFFISCFFYTSAAFAVKQTSLSNREVSPDNCQKDYGGDCGACTGDNYDVGKCTGFWTGGSACCITPEQYKTLQEVGTLPEDIPYSASEAECKSNGGICYKGCGSLGQHYGSYGICSGGGTPDVIMCCQASTSEVTASASFDYTPLEAIPGQESATDFPTYVKALYSFGIFSVGIAALVMVLFGGFIYVTAAGNTSQVDKGKTFIRDALIGIVVAFGSYLVLYIINPNLVNINLESLEKLALTSGGETYGPVPSKTGVPPISNPGSCGGIKTNGVGGCGLASAELSGMLSCMVGKGINSYSGYVYSVTSNAVGDNQSASAACCGKGHTSGCPHSSTSCHHGCTMSNKGLSYSVDYMTTSLSDAQICEVAQMAIECGAPNNGNIWGPRNMCGGKVRQQPGHSNHLHIPTSGCGH